MPGWNKWRNLYDALHVEWLGFAKDVTAELMHLEAVDSVADGSAADIAESLWRQWLDYLVVSKATKKMGKEICFTPLTIGLHAWHSYVTLAQRIKGAECTFHEPFPLRPCVPFQRVGVSSARPFLISTPGNLFAYVQLCMKYKMYMSHIELSEHA
jgi:hypothetical protein